MQLEWLRTLVVVAETGSITAAAERLGLSQPAVSKQLQQIERFFGVELKFWKGKEFNLTESGLDVLEWSQNIFSTLEVLQRTIYSRKTYRENMVIIVAGPSLLFHYVPALAGALRIKNPNWRISTLTVLDQALLTQAVIDRTADIALHTAPYKDHRLNSLPVLEDELVPVANPGHRFARVVAPKVGELAREELLLLPKATESRILIEHWFEANDYPLSEPVDLGSQAEIRARLLNTPSIGIVSRIVVARDLAEGSLIELGIPGFRLSRKIYASTRTHSNLAVTTAVEMMKAAFAAVHVQPPRT